MQSNSDFTEILERILQSSEGRHFTSKELSALSILCTTQSNSKGLDADLGFSDVDPSTTGQLVEALQTHVALASTVDWVGQGHKAMQQGSDYLSLESWLKSAGQESLDKLGMGLEAAAILLFVINSPGMDRSVINEDAIEACIVLFRHHLSKNVIPALNQVGPMTSTPKTPSTSAKKRRRSSAGDTLGDMKKVYRPIYRTIGLLVKILERIETLVQKIPLEDQQLLMISSGALMTLELDPALQSDVPIAHQLHEATIGVVTAIFRKYPRHRQILLEDLFPVMLKLPAYKKSMRSFPIQSSAILFPSTLKSLCQSLAPNIEAGSIQTMTALILSLIQSAVLRPHVPQTLQDQHDGNDESQTLVSGLSNCQAVSDMIVAQLLQRCAKKGEDGGASAFRPILANLIDDLLIILLVPEYPAAELLLMSIANRISRDLLQLCQSKAVETTHVNTILDALSKICAAQARILKFHRERPVMNGPATLCYCQKEHGTMVECGKCHSKYHITCVAMTKGIAPENWYCDACQLGRVVALEQDRNTNQGAMGCSPELIDESYCMRRLLIDYLSIMTRKSGIVGLQDSYEFHMARWLSELKSQQALQARVAELWDPRESSKIDEEGENTLNGMLHCLSDEGRSRIMIHIAVTQSQLLVSHRSQIGLFVNQLIGNKNSALLRKLSLKAIEKVTDADPQLMIYPFVRNAVTKRFSDEAISVREAAVSLVGLYVVHSPAVANAFHPAFMVGLQDSGVSVRKRTIKILQDILCTNPSYKGRAEACKTMLSLAADPKEDDSVRDAIHDLFLKVWLEHADEKVSDDMMSPSTPDVDKELLSPTSKVLDIEFTNAAEGVFPITPTPQSANMFSPPLSMRETRSTERRRRKGRLQIRSEIAAEQMVEVVKAADTGDHLTTLFRDLLENESDADKGRKTSSRRKRRTLAEGHCAMLVDAIFEILLRVEENRSNSSGATSNDVVAVMRTIGVFSSISPRDVHRHLDTLLPYLKADNGMSFQQEAVVVASISNAIALVAPVLRKDELDELGATSLADDLLKITYKFGRDALSSAICALCSLAHHKLGSENNPFRAKVLSLAKTFYGYLLKHRNDMDVATMTSKAKANVQRALSVLGAICRYHGSFTEDRAVTGMDEELEDVAPEELSFATLTSVFEKVFTVYLSKDDAQTKCAALRGLCGVFISRPREMLRMDQSGLITQVMAPDASLSLQLESLICWRDILLTEESRIESGEAKKRMDSKANITVSKKIAGDQDADATLFGGVLTSHASRLLQMTQVSDKKVRFAALDLVGHLLRQGQINPNETVPFLLALQGDVEEDGIRSLALQLLMIEGEKRPDMLRQRVYAGIKQAFAFQKAVYPTKEYVSALVVIRKDGMTQTECVFGKVFKECIANIRKQRRGLFASLLRRFDLLNKKKSVEATGKNDSQSAEEAVVEDLPLLSFTAQVLAYLPYKVASDPLFIIYSINAALALRGPELLDRLANFLRPYGLCSTDEMDETNYEEDALEIAAKRQLPRHAKQATRLLEADFDTQTFRSLCAEAAAQTLLLRLKTFLRTAYDLSESRIFGFNPDTKEEKEKAISKASVLSFDSTLSMARSDPIAGEMTEIDAMIFQYAEFRRLMRAETNLENMAMDDDDESDEEVEPTKKRHRSIASTTRVEDILTP